MPVLRVLFVRIQNFQDHNIKPRLVPDLPIVSVLRVLLLVVLVENLLLVQQQQIEHVQFVMQVKHFKIQQNIFLPRVNLVRHVLVAPK